MLLRQMKYFVSVVDCNSFTEAAEQNYISQSAISQQIQALEKDLGVPLIIRENRKFSLTPAGEYFYNHCKGILVEVEDLRRDTVQLGKDSDIIATNLTGSIMLIKDSLPYLRLQGGGRIIQMSTYGGQVAYPANSMYHATKFGIEGFCEAVTR